jgi:hypothetical protein
MPKVHFKQDDDLGMITISDPGRASPFLGDAIVSTPSAG